ncbi:hybrid sensor histidine kinase/response regulator [Salinivibrio proteolyticus]|uniref:hybrid sensor histidine kinase/response regulator n=1 Tax=Salinivibrio proteolyticus TaxID=334715 RepID=UPI00098909B5|nr:hybrid sensor histidine kinase/response regulator [Salinivibrio proteolyticus]OOF22812.1 hybrid sensor histidine kinase/response regulator [Salinivibrio proteolyticus]
MTQGWVIVSVSLLYMGTLFAIAWYGDSRPRWLRTWRPWIYSLSIAVYCTSWTFFGTVGQASSSPWSFLPIYLAPILVFTLGWRFLARMILIAKREHITSIADFIAARYGKSQGLAVAVTLIAVIGVLPYIALQLRGIAMGLDVLSPELGASIGLEQPQIAWLVCVSLAMFTVLFGTRHIDSTEHHRGMMMAIAFESIVKLVAFLGIGVFVVVLLFQAPSLPMSLEESGVIGRPDIGNLIIHTLLTAAAIICLPRQFHTMVVENTRASDLNTARKVFPTYLLLMLVFVLPLAYAGQMLIPDAPADTYVIRLPLSVGAEGMALLAFMGGASAASGMVIVSTIALAIMVSNDLVLPLLLRRMKMTSRNFTQFSGLLLNVRRALIFLILIAAWGFYHLILTVPTLSEIGFLSFAAIAQFAPAMIGALYWRQGNKKGVYAGLAVGFSLWLITMMTQTGMLAGDGQSNLLIWVITPPAIAPIATLDPIDWGLAFSVLMNAASFVAVSLLTRPSLSERLQAAAFVGMPLPESEDARLYQSRVTVAELEMLAARFVGRRRMRQAFSQFADQRGEDLIPQQQASAPLIRHTERVLAGVFGASSARLVLSSALQGRNMQLEEIATIVDEASELFDFSRGLLQGAIEHINQGISVVDKQLRLVAWNQRYIDMFQFPPGLIQVGRPVADLIRFNAQRGLCGPGDPEEHVEKRVHHLTRRQPHTSSRVHPDGRVIELQGNPMPGGGFVMTFTDITAFRQAEAALKQSNETLEARVTERTRELESLNSRLIDATRKAESASQSKSRFLAAVSHDLMQPLNAARLFASSLSEIAHNTDTQRVAGHIESALEGAEDLIGDLLDISRLESGKMKARIEHFALNDVLTALEAEFGVLANQQGMRFDVQHCQGWVRSDKKLLRRVLQNFLTNAFRYNPRGRVLLGVRREKNRYRIEVWDDGEGIPHDRQQDIFQEFTRLDRQGAEQGLGLGLAIAKGISQILQQPLGLRSWPGKGTVFSISVDQGTPEAVVPAEPRSHSAASASALKGCRVLCVDNEADILTGMAQLLSRWGCDVRCAPDVSGAMQQINDDWHPEFVLSDYHLANQQTGLQVLQQCQLRLGRCFRGAIISADRSADIQQSVTGLGFAYISKPVKPLKLRALLQQRGQ